MEKFDINRSSPFAEARTGIPAPIGLVWDVLTDLVHWPDWNTSIERISFRGPLERGSVFDWKAGGLGIRSRLEAVEAPVFVGWTGRAPLVRARHVWRLEETCDGTSVSTEESFEGLFARLLPKRTRHLIQASLEQGLGALAAECKRRQGATHGA